MLTTRTLGTHGLTVTAAARAAVAVAASCLVLGACVQSRVGAYRDASIAQGPAGFLSAVGGDRVVFEKGRMVHYPIPFVWSGGAYLWQVHASKLVKGAVLTLPDSGVDAVYQRFTHPVGSGVRDLRGTITIRDVSASRVVADVALRSDAADWSVRERVTYRWGTPEQRF